MNKLKGWVCPDPECPFDHATEICPELDKLLPQMHDGDSPKFATAGQMADMTVSVFQTHFWEHDEASFVSLMRNYGFTDQWDLDLLSAKYFRNLSVRDIEKEFHWTSKSAVQRKLKELRALLKERGFEQERS